MRALMLNYFWPGPLSDENGKVKIHIDGLLEQQRAANSCPSSLVSWPLYEVVQIGASRR
jgi:hypothetical protein